MPYLEVLELRNLVFRRVVVLALGDALRVVVPRLGAPFAPRAGGGQLLRAHAAPRLDALGRHDVMDIVAVALEDQFLVA